MRKQPRRPKSRPKPQPTAPKKYEKYRGQPRDIQRAIAEFGPKCAACPLARLIYLVARARQGTATIIPHPKDEWFRILEKAIRTADGKDLRRAGEIAQRAHQAIQHPVDPVAMRILDVLQAYGQPNGGNQTNALPMTVLEFVDGYFPNSASREGTRRKVQMIADPLGVKFEPAKPTATP